MDPFEEQSEVDRVASTTSSRPPGNPFQPFHTWLYAVAWALVMLQGWGGYIGSNPTARLYYPTETSARIVNRDLEIATVNEGAGRQNVILSALDNSLSEALEMSIWIQRDVISVLTVPSEDQAGATKRHGDLDLANTRLAILLVEANRVEEARLAVSEIRDPELTTAMTSLIPAETDSPNDPSQIEVQPPGIDTLRALASAGIEEWMIDRVAIRLLGQAAVPEVAGATIDDLRNARDTERRDIRDALSIADIAFVVAGALLLIPVALRIRHARASEPFVPPWSSSLGWAVMIRADFWNRLYFVVLSDFGVRLENPDWLLPFYAWGSLLASLPMLWLIGRYLVAGSLREFVTTFGLNITRERATQIASTTAATVAINFMGVFALGWAFYWVGTTGIWSEGLDETLLWGTTSEVVDVCIDYLVWTPTFEELLFRGLLFFTLRHRMNALNAATVSAVAFSLIHFYSLPGFVMTLWGGFVWAFAFEHARSLWPGIFAHSFYNLFFVAGTLLIYR